MDGRAGEGPRRILIVEDDPFFASLLADFVLARGYTPLVAADGEQGLQLARLEAPHAVLLDVMMARMDGWEVMRQLRADPCTCHLPVHFISCLDEIQRARELGALGLVTKPVSPEQLAQVFDRIEQAWAGALKRVLVVEDDESQLSSLSALLASREVEVVRCKSGREALDMLVRGHFDCMVLDLGLQDMSGYEVLEALQASPGLRQLPVVIHSGQDLTREQLRMLNRYARSVIIKVRAARSACWAKCSCSCTAWSKAARPCSRKRWHWLAARCWWWTTTCATCSRWSACWPSAGCRWWKRRTAWKRSTSCPGNPTSTPC